MQGNQVANSDRTIAGVVQGLTFHNTETGFFVARVRVPGVRDEHVVVGTSPSITAGEQLEARGRWVMSQYGRQFKADEVRLTLPVDEEGLVKFMASALPGIGRAYATKLVQAFGTDVSRVIEQEPHRLASVAGIGKKRAEAIVEIWAERGANHEVLAWLCGLGLSPALATRVHVLYGPEARDVIKVNPYQLAEDIHGIGFRRAAFKSLSDSRGAPALDPRGNRVWKLRTAKNKSSKCRH